jgi:hypothetical protein
MTLTVLAPIKLAPGRTEAELLAASSRFDRDFVRHQPGVLRRELVRKADGSYLDIVQFGSEEDLRQVIAAEESSPVCHAFFAVMDLAAGDAHETCTSLATYAKT